MLQEFYEELQDVPNAQIKIGSKGGIQTKGIWKQDPEVNIWAQEGWEWGMEKAPQWGTS